MPEGARDIIIAAVDLFVGVRDLEVPAHGRISSICLFVGLFLCLFVVTATTSLATILPLEVVVVQ